MRDADAGSHGYRTDGPPTGPRRLRVPEMHVCDERLGVKRSGPFGGRAPEGSRLGCPLTHCPHFARASAPPGHPADLHRL
jgi:hypothetical protein